MNIATKEYLLQVVDGMPGLVPGVLRGVLRGGSWLYGLGLEIDLFCYQLGLAKVTQLPVEVISVGNLSMGGTGKTLAVIKLARELLAAGKRVAILSRGYRRKSSDPVAVVSTPDGIRLTPAEAGDEPCLLAASLPGVPVLVGKNRRLTGQAALEQFSPDVLLLDDGFQYWRLHKDREIVLLDALQPATRDELLPRGLLREPWSHLRRAHEAWITHAELADPTRVTELTHRVYRHAPQATIRFTEHAPTGLRALSGETAPLSLLQGRRVLALSGLGNPTQFERMLETLGAEVMSCRYPDHHPYTAGDLAEVARRAGDAFIVTTAKDAIRFPADACRAAWVVEVELAEVRRTVGKQG